MKGRMDRTRKTVQVGGVTWTIISRNERATTHAGRHFFACRCSRNPLWRIDEMNQAQIHGSRTLRTIGTCMTKGLSTMVIAVTTPAVAQ